MHTSRSIRGIARIVKQYPKFDRVTFSKGGYPRNVYIDQKVQRLTPFTTFVTNSDYNNIYDRFNQNCIMHCQRIAFSTSKQTFSDDSLSQKDLKKAVDNLTDQFMETRELLEDARETLGTVYFSDDMKDASDAVKNTLQEYEELLSKLSDAQRRDVIRTIGLKMKELEAQHQALEQDES